MLARMVAVLAVVIFGAPLPAAASPASAHPWPYRKACLETEIKRLVAFRDVEANTVEINNLVGASRPCAGNRAPVKGVRLALTQYSVTGNAVVGWMGSPWRTNSIGDTSFRRTGTIPGDLAALCLSTGVTVRRDGVFAVNNRCFRPVWVDDASIWDVEDVPLDDPVVTAALQRAPAAGDTAPAGCANCLVTDPVAALPEPEPLPYAGTVESGCTRVHLDSVGRTERGSVQVRGTIRACGGDTIDDLAIGAVFYGVHGGRLGSPWDLEGDRVAEFDRQGALAPGEEAVCITSGRRQTDDGSFARNVACVALRTDHRGNVTVVRIPVDDRRVRKPVDTVFDGDPPGTCATCL
jgi:hypothetical protein